MAVYWDKNKNQLEYDSVLLLVGPKSTFINYDYPSSVFLVQELDGLRVFSPVWQHFVTFISLS